MSLTRNALQALVDEVRPLLKGAELLNFTSLESRKFVLTVQNEKRKLAVLFCLQEPFLRFHLFSGATKGSEHPLAKKFGGQIIQDITLVNNDRIVRITFQDQSALIAELFARRPNLFYVDATQRILYALNPVTTDVYQIPQNALGLTPIVSESGLTSAQVEAVYQQKERTAAFEKEKQTIQMLLQQRVKRARKGVEKAHRELEKCLQWESVQHEGQLLQANMFKVHKGLSELAVEDWLAEGTTRYIILDPLLEPKDEVSKRFKLSKKLKAGVAYAEKWLKEAEVELQQSEMDYTRIVNAQTWDELQYLKPPEKAAKAKVAPSLPYHEFITEAGLTIWVGKRAQANEKLTFSLAKGSDWWLHVNDYPGSHVILRVSKNQEPDQASLQDALQVALAYSKAKDKGEADILVTQCKYVARLKKGAPGQVQVSHHRLMHARFDAQHFEAIKRRGAKT